MPETSSHIKPIIIEFVQKIENILGKKCSKVIMYGAFSRVKEYKSSEADLMVLTNVRDSGENRKIEKNLNEVAFEFEMTYQISISVIVNNEKKFYDGVMYSAFYRHIKEEGKILYQPKPKVAPKARVAPKSNGAPKTSMAPKANQAPKASVAPQANQAPLTNIAPKAVLGTQPTPKIQTKPSPSRGMNLIVAVDKNWAIGLNNKLLAKNPEDLKYFKQMTLNKVVVMGRKTLESLPLGLPLQNRTNIILTTNKNYKRVDGETVVHSLQELEEELKKYKPEDIFVIGGESIYKQLLPHCKFAYVTKMENSFKADTWFPNLDELKQWKMILRSTEQAYSDIKFRYTKYQQI